MPERRKITLLLAAILAVLTCIVTVAVIGMRAKETAPPSGAPSSAVQSGSKGKRFLDVEREIIVSTLEEGMRDMGLLVTQEYCFTDAVTQSKIRTLFSIPLGFTETTYIATYDGVVTAGIDFTGISFELDTTGKKVTVHMPKAGILSVDIDPESFVLYSERSGFGNPLSASDFNGSLVELEARAKERAAERGMVEKADENAKRIVSNYIAGFLDPDVYEIVWVTEG
ncbi:MAG: DUF4230 domain-containing protein [Clostridiales bacterium]|nr:DUF4230 domain-containing protein [Clostridiales bacterium]